RKLEIYIRRIRIFGIGDKLYDFYTAISIYRYKRTAILIGILLSFGVQTAIGIQNYFIARSLHLQLDLLPCIVFPSIISVIIMLPSIGGLGIREVSYIYFFNMLGIPKEASFSLSIIFYLVGVIGSLPGAVIFPLMKRFRKEDKQL
ncbi:flippase-like domain-containing protein, partial [candidate division WOR-3 bacterium]|nr:flippase-like domain-containing protein [candidate division WOR-3 bacterium]